MLNKKAYSIQMNYSVPESEKQIAKQAEAYLEYLENKLDKFSQYLDIIYLPFKKYHNVDMEMITEYRRTFIQYKDEVKKRFLSINDLVYKIIKLLNNFSSDTSTSEIVESFINSVKDLEKYVETFVSIFSNFNDNDFSKYIISTIDSINKQINQTKQLVKDRLVEHIDTNILAKDWMSDLETKIDLEENTNLPLVMRLFRERQEALSKK